MAAEVSPHFERAVQCAPFSTQMAIAIGAAYSAKPGWAAVHALMAVENLAAEHGLPSESQARIRLMRADVARLFHIKEAA